MDSLTLVTFDLVLFSLNTYIFRHLELSVIIKNSHI